MIFFYLKEYQFLNQINTTSTMIHPLKIELMIEKTVQIKG